jgi:DNA-binding IclR family transcriptional regulator
MQWTDERILEYLSEEGETFAWAMAHDINRDDGRVRRRLRVLARADLVERVEREGKAPNWRLSSWGELYLSGEVDADLRRPVPGVRPPDKIRPGWWAGFG